MLHRYIYLDMDIEWVDESDFSALMMQASKKSEYNTAKSISF